jgi:hypothetical protein
MSAADSNLNAGHSYPVVLMKETLRQSQNVRKTLCAPLLQRSGSWRLQHGMHAVVPYPMTPRAAQWQPPYSGAVSAGGMPEQLKATYPVCLHHVQGQMHWMHQIASQRHGMPPQHTDRHAYYAARQHHPAASDNMGTVAPGPQLPCQVVRVGCCTPPLGGTTIQRGQFTPCTDMAPL